MKKARSKKAGAKVARIVATPIKPLAALEAIRRDAKAEALDKLTMRQINVIIKEYRRERRASQEANK